MIVKDPRQHTAGAASHRRKGQLGSRSIHKLGGACSVTPHRRACAGARRPWPAGTTCCGAALCQDRDAGEVRSQVSSAWEAANGHRGRRLSGQGGRRAPAGAQRPCACTCAWLRACETGRRTAVGLQCSAGRERACLGCLGGCGRLAPRRAAGCLQAARRCAGRLWRSREMYAIGLGTRPCLECVWAHSMSAAARAWGRPTLTGGS